MEIKSRIIALAVSVGFPVTLVAESPNDIYRGEYLLKISVPGVPWPVTASSTYEPDGRLKEIDSQLNRKGGAFYEPQKWRPLGSENSH